MLNMRTLWRPGDYVDINTTTYGDFRMIIGDEGALPELWTSATNAERRFSYLLDDSLGVTTGKRLGVEPE